MLIIEEEQNELQITIVYLALTEEGITGSICRNILNVPLKICTFAGFVCF